MPLREGAPAMEATKGARVPKSLGEDGHMVKQLGVGKWVVEAIGDCAWQCRWQREAWVVEVVGGRHVSDHGRAQWWGNLSKT